MLYVIFIYWEDKRALKKSEGNFANFASFKLQILNGPCNYPIRKNINHIIWLFWK